MSGFGYLHRKQLNEKKPRYDSSKIAVHAKR